MNIGDRAKAAEASMRHFLYAAEHHNWPMGYFAAARIWYTLESGTTMPGLPKIRKLLLRAIDEGFPVAVAFMVDMEFKLSTVRRILMREGLIDAQFLMLLARQRWASRRERIRVWKIAHDMGQPDAIETVQQLYPFSLNPLGRWDPSLTTHKWTTLNIHLEIETIALMATRATNPFKLMGRDVRNYIFSLICTAPHSVQQPIIRYMQHLRHPRAARRADHERWARGIHTINLVRPTLEYGKDTPKRQRIQ